jgi:hypothetical protein
MRWCGGRVKTHCSKQRRTSKEMLRGFLTVATVAVACSVAGCKSAPAPSPTPAQPAAAMQYPTRPTVPPPPFQIFHHDASSITLITKESATDAEIESLIWELRDTAHAHTFDKLKIDQKWVDSRDPMMWFHIYRGSKCASEKYASGTLPCGGSYHAAGEYTLGGFTNRDHDDGLLRQGEDRQTQLWNPEATTGAENKGATQ